MRLSPHVAARLILPWLILAHSHLVAAQAQGSIRYIYDDLGRLIGVVDQLGSAATYTYDAVGNILEIERFTVTQDPPHIAALIPAGAEAGRDVPVTITGQNLLIVRRLMTDNPGIVPRFLTATPEAISAVFSIAPTAPLGPATVTVTTAFGSATTVLTVVPRALVLARLVPAEGALGTATTLEGEGFVSAGGPTGVTFAAQGGGRVTASLTAPATSTRLTVAVPLGTVSGDVVVTVGGRPSNALPFTRLVPQVTSVSPANRATAVSVTSPVSVTFSPPVNPASVTATTLTVSAGGAPIPALVYGTSTSASLFPTARLEYGLEHTVTVSTGVTAPDGVPGVAFSSRFTTEAAPVSDVRFDAIVATAAKGTPADPTQPSANAIQPITIRGANLSSAVVVETSRLAGGVRQATPAQLFLTSISADSTSATTTLGTLSGTGPTRLRKAGVPSVEAHLLQIVPTLGGVNVPGGGRLAPGKTVFVNGNGFTADLRVSFPLAGSGTVALPIVAGSIDPFNVSAQVVVPQNLGSGSVLVVTPGGTSNALVVPGLTRLENLDGTLARAATGMPANPAEASTNGDQDLVVRGSGLAAGMSLEVPIARNGVFLVNTLLSLTNAGAEGTTARGHVPKVVSNNGLISGLVRVVHASAALESPQSLLLQAVPTLTSVAAPAGSSFAPGVTLTVNGSGFTADMVVRFPLAAGGTVDQPIVSGSVNQIGSQAQVLIPAGAARAPMTVLTPGGQSNATTP